MKNDRLHATWRHAGTPSNLDEFCADRTLTLGQPASTSESAASESASTVMGLQPLTHATTRLPLLVASCAPSGGVGVAVGVAASDQNCSCVVKPQDRTILHGILTGQGHKFGYGEAYVSPVFTDSSGLADSDNGLYPNNNNNNNNNNTQSLDDHEKVHSQEATSPSKCTIQLRDK